MIISARRKGFMSSLTGSSTSHWTQPAQERIAKPLADYTTTKALMHLRSHGGGGTGFLQSALQPQSRIYCKGFFGGYARRLSDRRHGASVKLPRQQSISTIHQKAILFRDAFRTCCFYRSGNKAAYEGQQFRNNNRLF